MNIRKLAFVSSFMPVVASGLQVNIMCDKSAGSNSTHCDLPILEDITPNHQLLDALQACVYEVTNETQVFINPTPSEVPVRRLRAGVQRELQIDCLDPEVCLDPELMEYCCLIHNYSYCAQGCSNCSCERRLDASEQQLRFIRMLEDGSSRRANTVSDEQAIETKCSKMVKVLAAELIALDNHCLGTNSGNIKCHATIFGA